MNIDDPEEEHGIEHVQMFPLDPPYDASIPMKKPRISVATFC